jgi:bacterial/archaeal transporter family-2 protein
LNARFFVWSLAAGALIPAMAILNARLGRALGSALLAPVLLFAIGLFVSAACALALTHGLPALRQFGDARVADYSGGFIVAFYVITATLLAPRIGVGNFIVLAVSGQILSAALIDHFGLFGAATRPLDALRIAGMTLVVVGIVLTQLPISKRMV